MERLPPAEGQEPAGSWAQIRGIARADKVFAAMLAILAFQVLMAFLGASILGAILGGVILWGVLSFRWWGYWLALLGALFGLLASVSFMGLGMASAKVARSGRRCPGRRRRRRTCSSRSCCSRGGSISTYRVVFGQVG